MLYTAAIAALIASAAAKDGRTFGAIYFQGNGPLTEGRSDPIVSPGQFSGHVHTIQGSNGFSNSATGATLTAGNCTTAKVAADKSAYWMPKLYFYDKSNNSFEPVPMFYMKIYYFFEGTNDIIKPFPVGLKIVSGNSSRRTAPATASMQLDPSQGPIQPVQWVCSRTDGYNPPSWPANSDGTTAPMGVSGDPGTGNGFPDANCDTSSVPLRANLHFPSCYDPSKALDDWQHNMQWPVNNGNKQDCPTGWIHVPHLFYELYWNTPLFKNRWTQHQGNQPFVLANGDMTGYSLHGDFISGWDTTVLQHIIDTCDSGSHGDGIDSCPGITVSVDDNKCHITNPSPENIDGSLSALPGNNPLWGFPVARDAGGSTTTTTASSTPTLTKSISSSSTVSSPSLTKSASSSPTTTSPAFQPAGWKYAGCYQDTDARVINDEPYANVSPMSNLNCVTHCKNNGWTIAGTEYARQCFCGNSVHGAKKIAESNCNMACNGDSKDICGGPNALSVYSVTGTV